MSKILLIAEHDGANLNPSTAKCVTCAAEIPDAEIHVAVLAEDGKNISAEAAGLTSVARVLQLDNPANAYPLAAVLAPQIVALAADYSHVLGPSTTFGKDLMPRVAVMSKSKSKDSQAENQETSQFTVSDRRHWVLEDEEENQAGEPAERLPSYVEQLKQQAESKDKQLREYIAAYKSKSAEIDEIRVRLQKENANRLEQIKADFFKTLIPILDNFKRAIDSAQSSADYESLKQGIEMTYSQLLNALEESGVETIATSGRKFNAGRRLTAKRCCQI